MKYYWLIITLLFVVKILQGKQLSSYNIKWMLAYIIYILWLQAEGFNEEEEWSYIIEPFIWCFFLLPLVAYIGKWKPFKVIDNFIDKWYRTIKELNQ